MQETPFSLLNLAGKQRQDYAPSSWAVVTIDAQEEYRSGKLALPGVAHAIEEGKNVLQMARSMGIPVFHVAHKAPAGSMTFAMDSDMVSLFREYEVQKGERILHKSLPNSFAGTDLLSQLQEVGRKHLIVFGFMTHMCVSSTVRAALDHGFLSTVVADACATRPLPGLNALAIPAETVHQVALAEIGDRFGFVVKDSHELFAL